MKGRFNFPNVKTAHARNLDLAQADSFVGAAITMVDKATRQTPAYRIHGSGDFYSTEYVEKWIAIAEALPTVQFWAYTRSWRVPEMLPALETLRGLDNVQLFASMDRSISEAPPEGWRVAWTTDDARATGYVCPEQTGIKASCADCGYCFKGRKHNVQFITH